MWKNPTENILPGENEAGAHSGMGSIYAAVTHRL